MQSSTVFFFLIGLQICSTLCLVVGSAQLPLTKLKKLNIAKKFFLIKKLMF